MDIFFDNEKILFMTFEKNKVFDIVLKYMTYNIHFT